MALSLAVVPMDIAFGQPSAATQSAPVSSDITAAPLDRRPGPLSGGGADLPNGWRIRPAGRSVATLADTVTNLAVSPDGKIIVAINSGFLPHGLTVFDAKTHRQLQRIELPAAFVGLAWSPDGRTLYASGGNAKYVGNYHTALQSAVEPTGQDANRASVFEFAYANGRLSAQPTARLSETLDPKEVWWSGLAYAPDRRLLYAINQGTGAAPGDVVVFDARTRQLVTRIPVEMKPYQAVLTKDGKRLFVSNWSSGSVSVIDTVSNRVVAALKVGRNPSDMKLSVDGRLFVVCASDNTVHVIDAATLEPLEQLSTSLWPHAPEGSTPNALVIDEARKRLYIANGDNNAVAVAQIENRTRSAVIGFIPTGWYPSALALTDGGAMLVIANAKGERPHPDPKGPGSPLVEGARINQDFKKLMELGGCSVHCVQTSSLEVLRVADLDDHLPEWTKRVAENTPYRDALLREARPPKTPSVIPQAVGQGSPIKHVIYIIKENRTYDQVFGDLPGANGDPRLTIFGEKVTPNLHALAKEYVILDNFYCDGEVSMDGHYWSNAAYATDFIEKIWPSIYAGRSSTNPKGDASSPASGFLWGLAKRKGLTFRSYFELRQFFETRDPSIEAIQGPGYEGGDWIPVDGKVLEVFRRELRDYDANYDSPDPDKRLPNLTIMSLPDDHTKGTMPGAQTPTAMVASNDYVVGQLVEAVSHSRYWPETAIFIIEDDAQDGPDHVDARRTEALVISPYVKRGIVDSTLYSTASMLRTMELLLGLPPMSQFDAAATPMYASFGAVPVVKPYTAIKPRIDITATNKPDAYGAKESAKMNFAELDRAPMYLLNEIIWKSVKGAASPMPAPVHRFRPLVELADDDDKD
jgi:YVTN family beta-propeller protein